MSTTEPIRNWKKKKKKKIENRILGERELSFICAVLIPARTPYQALAFLNAPQLCTCCKLFSLFCYYQTHVCPCIWGPYVRLTFVPNMLSSWNKIIINRWREINKAWKETDEMEKKTYPSKQRQYSPFPYHQNMLGARQWAFYSNITYIDLYTVTV